MVQVRKLVLAIAAASALSSGMAHALGLGELSVKSTLNQPLVAEIELTEAQGLNASQVVPSLATTADFAQAGVTRQAFLNDLTFTPVINASGKSVLRITSSRPVREPFVKFLVQVLWPNGRLLRSTACCLIRLNIPRKRQPLLQRPRQLQLPRPSCLLRHRLPSNRLPRRQRQPQRRRPLQRQSRTAVRAGFVHHQQ